jgi:hypothetical protein
MVDGFLDISIIVFLPRVISRTLGFPHINRGAAQQSRNKGRCNAKCHQAALEKLILKDILPLFLFSSRFGFSQSQIL